MKTHGKTTQINHNFHILIIESDDYFSTKLVTALSAYYQTSTLDEIKNLPTLLSRQSISLIILNEDSCEDATFKWLEWLTANRTEVPVILISEKNTSIHRVRVLEAGARDYLSKPFEIMELLLRAKNILRDTGHPEVRKSLFNPERRLFIRDEIKIKLTITETKLLQFLYQNSGKIISRDAISEALRGDQHHPLDRSIDVHVSRLRNKIEANPTMPKLLNTVWGKGYRFIKPD
ncbi:MAG TPA: response regulator transcription factor [Thiolinea sp.]|nr:response regulator transcription factor [Thiolinea sp.]